MDFEQSGQGLSARLRWWEMGAFADPTKTPQLPKGWQGDRLVLVDPTRARKVGQRRVASRWVEGNLRECDPWTFEGFRLNVEDRDMPGYVTLRTFGSEDPYAVLERPADRTWEGSVVGYVWGDFRRGGGWQVRSRWGRGLPPVHALAPQYAARHLVDTIKLTPR